MTDGGAEINENEQPYSLYSNLTVNNLHVGKMGYLTEENMLQPWKNTMLESTKNNTTHNQCFQSEDTIYSDVYIYAGEYKLGGKKNLNNLSVENWTSQNDSILQIITPSNDGKILSEGNMKKEANSNEDCAGFILKKDGSEGILFNNKGYPCGTRIRDSNYKMYLRKQKIKSLNINETCDKTSSPYDSLWWQKFIDNGAVINTPMDETTICGVDRASKMYPNVENSYYNNYEKAYNKYKETMDELIELTKDMSEDHKNELIQMNANINHLDKDIIDYENIKKRWKVILENKNKMDASTIDTNQQLSKTNNIFILCCILLILLVVIIIRVVYKKPTPPILIVLIFSIVFLIFKYS